MQDTLSQWGMVEDRYILWPAIPLLEMCARYTCKNIPSNFVVKFINSWIEKINSGIIISQDTAKQWYWKNYKSLQLHEYHKRNVEEKNPDTKGGMIYDSTYIKLRDREKLNECMGICAYVVNSYFKEEAND